MFSIFRGIREATRIVQPWCLLNARYWRWRRDGFGDGVVDLVPEAFLRFVAYHRIQERFDTVDIEIIRIC